METSAESAMNLSAEALGFESVRVEVNSAATFMYGPQDSPQPVHSIRKSVMGLLLDEVVADGRLGLATTLHDLGIEDPHLRWPTATITVEHLVSSGSGNFDPVAGAEREQLCRAGLGDLAGRRPFRPGQGWRYNNWDFNVLGAVYAEASGRSVFDGVDRLASRLGLEDWARDRDATWKRGRDALGANERFANYRLSFSARDLARLGSACLMSLDDKGPFSRAWLGASTSGAVKGTGLPSPRERYGYLWWAAGPDSAGVPEDSFWAWGSGGQYLLVVPSRRTVVALLRPVPRSDGRYSNE